MINKCKIWEGSNARYLVPTVYGYFESSDIMVSVKAAGMITLLAKMTRQRAWLFDKSEAEVLPTHPCQDSNPHIKPIPDQLGQWTLFTVLSLWDPLRAAHWPLPDPPASKPWESACAIVG